MHPGASSSAVAGGAARCASLTALAALVHLTACSSIPDSPAAGDAPRHLASLAKGAPCAECELTLEPVVTLGASGPARVDFGEWPSVARSSAGHLVASAERGTVLIMFDSSGRELRRVGRAGDGPGEFRSIGPMHFGPGDTLYVKSGPATVTTLDPELAVVRRFELLSDCQLAAPGGGLVCTGAGFDSASGIQQPLHRATPAGQVLHSFGRSAADSTCLRCAVYLAAGGDDPREGFWLITTRDYRMERWSFEGAILDSLQVDSDWLPGATRMIPGGPREGKASGRVWGLQRTREGMLLVFGSTPTTDQAREINPRGGVRRMDVAQVGYSSVIELLDPQAGVVASSRFPDRRLMPLAGGMAYSTRYDDSGFVMIDVWGIRRGAHSLSIASRSSR